MLKFELCMELIDQSACFNIAGNDFVEWDQSACVNLLRYFSHQDIKRAVLIALCHANICVCGSTKIKGPSSGQILFWNNTWKVSKNQKIFHSPIYFSKSPPLTTHRFEYSILHTAKYYVKLKQQKKQQAGIQFRTISKTD